MAKGLRYNAGKPQLTLPLEAGEGLIGVARVMEYGTQKYARSNWLKGLPHTQIADSLLRHLVAYLSGEDVDPESGCRHVDHIACNALFLAHLTATKPEDDDRPSAQTE